MDTLTIFGIGTKHTSNESWTLMRGLRDLTATQRIVPFGQVPRTSEADVTLLFDGPPTFSPANRILDENARWAIEFISRNRPSTICLLGHSRGAVLATMIAARLNALKPSWSPTVHLWMIDTVVKTDVGGRGQLDVTETLTVYPNVTEFVRIVMEDDYQPWFVFPLETVEIGGAPGDRQLKDYEHRDEGRTGPSTTILRMPGSHGTGTQINPENDDGDTLPNADITSAPPGTIWPIGEVCLINALDVMRRWGVPLTAEGRAFVGQSSGDPIHQRNLLDAYGRILSRNRRRRNNSIRLNDADPSRTGSTQSVDWRKGERKAKALEKFGPDLRLNRLLANEQHKELIGEMFGTELRDRMAAAGTGASRQIAPTAPQRSDGTIVLTELDDEARVVLEALDEMHADHGPAYATLVQAGVTFGGCDLFDRLLGTREGR